MSDSNRLTEPCEYMYIVLSLPQAVLVFRLVPYKEQHSAPEVQMKKYSPFQVSTSNKAEYAVARLDDLVNWSLKVCISGVLGRTRFNINEQIYHSLQDCIFQLKVPLVCDQQKSQGKIYLVIVTRQFNSNLKPTLVNQ